jgi:hypothetical protein
VLSEEVWAGLATTADTRKRKKIDAGQVKAFDFYSRSCWLFHKVVKYVQQLSLPPGRG